MAEPFTTEEIEEEARIYVENFDADAPCDHEVAAMMWAANVIALTTRLRAAEAVVEAARTLDPFCWDEQESVKDDAFGDAAVEFSDCGQCAPCQVWNLIRSFDTLRETES